MADSKKIFVTGGNAGIGLALCKHLLVDEGCTVYMGSRDLGRGTAAIDSLALAPEVKARCTLVQIDTASDDSVKAAAATLKDLLAGASLYAVVNNAGAGLSQAGITPEIILNTNLHGVKRVTEAFLPMVDSTVGRVVNLGSGAAGGYVNRLGKCDAARQMMKDDITWDEILEHVKANFGGPADAMGGYGISKAAMLQYTKICAREHPNILFSACSPGFIKTAMTEGYGASKSPEEAVPVLHKMLFEKLGGNGWYYGSDGVRSPYHYMRNPGEPEFDGKMAF